MKTLKVGHYTNPEAGTGASVFLFNPPAVGAYIICGSGPATHELVPLDSDMSINHVHGLMFAGGSAFGLFAVQGVMRYLSERNLGIELPHGVVPIVPAVGIYDLFYKKAEPPTAENVYQACVNATVDNTNSGAIGAGTGATVGKLILGANAMTAGIGFNKLNLPNGIEVYTYVVVNAVGDILDEKGKIVAGASSNTGEFLNSEQYLLSGKIQKKLFHGGNTTLAAVFTNAKFNKSELKRIAKMAIAGMARAIVPVFTDYDGDILFAFSIGDKTASTLSVGSIAATSVKLAILDAVKGAKMI